MSTHPAKLVLTKDDCPHALDYLTYLPSANGNWVYCCAFQNVYTKQVVGWQVWVDMPEALVGSALQWCLLAQRLAPGLILHSD